jgi:hypothetical protein
MLKRFELLKESEYCLVYLTDCKDGDISNLRTKLNKQQIYSFLVQILYALQIMYENDFYHLDLHAKNVLYIKTKKNEYINIFNNKIKTFGYIFSLTDFNYVISMNFPFINDEKKLLLYADLKTTINLRIFFDFIFDNNEDILNISYKIRNNKEITIKDKEKFNNFLLNYDDTVYFLLHSNDNKSLINYFIQKIL